MTDEFLVIENPQIDDKEPIAAFATDADGRYEV